MNLNNRFSQRNRERQSTDVSTREYQEQVLSRSRGFLLTIVIFTVINLVLLVADSGTMFLFSASVPYYLTLISMAMDNGVSGGWAVGTNAGIALGISAVVCLVYLGCWLLSARRSLWLNVGIVVFVLDTAALIYVALKVLNSPLEGIVDLLVHVLLLWEMSKGVTAAKNLKNMEPEKNAGPEF